MYYVADGLIGLVLRQLYFCTVELKSKKLAKIMCSLRLFAEAEVWFVCVSR